MHSLNILVKYVRLYGLDHKRTEGQFEITWKELQDGLPKGAEGSFLLGVSENKLLLDGIPLETGQAERSFAQLLTTAGLASIHFSQPGHKGRISSSWCGPSPWADPKPRTSPSRSKSTFGDSQDSFDPDQ